MQKRRKSVRHMSQQERHAFRQALDEQGKSLCGKCLKVKPKSEFNKSAKIWNGITNACKVCCRANQEVTLSRKAHNQELLNEGSPK